MEKLLIDFFREVSNVDSRFGVATVQTDHAIRKCRINNLRVVYFLVKNWIVVGAPKSCSTCEVHKCCIDIFGQQIIEKNNK